VLELKAAPEAQSEAETLMALLAKGEKWSGEMVLQRKDASTFPAYVCDAPILNSAGDLIGVVGVSFDNSERKRAEESQALLVRELHHRVKNTLATVQAIMGSTARSSATIEEFRHAFGARINSLARTHTLIAQEDRQAVDFHDLLWAELEPYDDGSGQRIVLDGPRVVLPSELAIPIGMAVHELTTNAAKHGALAEMGSSVEVRWKVSSESEQRALLWEWNEHDGPPVELPTREGFGSRLLNRVLTVQTGADVKIDYQRDGLCVRASVPLPT
jgi:two-component sensor histidine kinase